MVRHLGYLYRTHNERHTVAMAAMLSSARALAPVRVGSSTAPGPSRRRAAVHPPPRCCASPSSPSSRDEGDDRKVMNRRAVSVGALAAMLAARPALANMVGDDTGEPTGLDPTGKRLRKCPATYNCVTTSSIGGAPSQFATAWTAPVKNLDEAIAQITQATLRACPDARQLDSFELDDGGRYVRFAMLGKLGVDNVEFLIKNEGIGERNWEGDEDQRKDYLVTFRSFATTVKYVYPFMTPVSDLGEQRKRMERIRGEVEWPRVGCEIEGFCDNDL